jgi:phosphatidylethanolamine-binding protein
MALRPSSRIYDLSVVASQKLVITTSEGPKETSITIALETTTLLISNIQNFFLDTKYIDHPHGLDAMGPTSRVIEKCRDDGI